MRAEFKYGRLWSIVGVLLLGLSFQQRVVAASNSAARSLSTPANPSKQESASSERDGQHDFDFEIGTWKAHISRLQHPLTGSATWIKMEGIMVVRPVWNGRANLMELEVDTPTGHFEELDLRLYNPQSHQWSCNYSNSEDGTMAQPMIGEFKNGRGEFIDQESVNGKTILVRHVFSDITPDSHHFEQAFSDDGGKTWEPNFVTTLTRESQDPDETKIQGAGEEVAGQHEFDWQFGDWKVHMSRLLHPLTGSKTWIPLDGTVIVKKIWNGRANLAEIEVSGPSGHLEFLSLRLYDPQTHEWTLHFASSNSGEMSVPMYGTFKDGRGVFYDQESANGKTIFVRFVFSDVTANSGRDEQAFSDDGGKTWEVNWINMHTRMKDASEGGNLR